MRKIKVFKFFIMQSPIFSMGKYGFIQMNDLEEQVNEFLSKDGTEIEVEDVKFQFVDNGGAVLILYRQK